MAAKAAITAQSGIGLRPLHYHEICQQRPPISWLEVHSENFLGRGGPPWEMLLSLRRDYPISLHGVGLSLGSDQALDSKHMRLLTELIAHIEPCLVSEHLSWGAIDGMHFNDLLPLPYTEESLNHMCDQVTQLQDQIQHPILVENPSSYLQYRHSTIDEASFLNALSERSGCGILLDINNLYVSAENQGLDANAYLATITPDAVQEFHLAGHASRLINGQHLLLDDHGSAVSEPVWELYRQALTTLGKRPSLIEWDSDIPPLEDLLNEAKKAEHWLNHHDNARAA